MPIDAIQPFGFTRQHRCRRKPEPELMLVAGNIDRPALAPTIIPLAEREKACAELEKVWASRPLKPPGK